MSGRETIDTISQGIAPASLSGVVTGSAVDTTGYDEAFIIVDLGAVTAGGTLDVKVETDDNSGFTSAADVTGAAFSQFTSTDANTAFIGRVNLDKTERYIRAHATQATAAIIGGVIIILSRGHQRANPTSFSV